MAIIVLIFLGLVNFLLLRKYPDKENSKLKKYFPILILVWLIFAVLFLNIFPSQRSGIGYALLWLGVFILSVGYHLFFLVCVRAIKVNNIWYVLLFLPMSYLLFNNLILWNKPTYNGAMDGFAAIGTMMRQIQFFILYPTFMFSLSMLKINYRIKGILLILIALTSTVLGIRQCIGKEGYLSDDTGYAFAFMILLLIAVGVYFLLNERKFLKNKSLFKF